MKDKVFTKEEVIQIIRDRMYTMENGRTPREGCNSRFYDLIYFIEHGHDDPDGAFSEVSPEP